MRLRSRERPKGASGSTEVAAPSGARRPSSGGAVRGGTQRGSREAGSGDVSTAAKERAARATERGAQRACARLATGALAVFAVDPLSISYTRATGALAVFADDPLSISYTRAIGALAVFADDLRATVYKRAAEAFEVFTAKSRVSYDRSGSGLQRPTVSPNTTSKKQGSNRAAPTEPARPTRSRGPPILPPRHPCETLTATRPFRDV